MAKYRQLYTEFWSDSFVLELTPEEKYFYLYLISNSKTTQCGIYELSTITIENDTGYNRETVEKLIKRFCDYKKILYCPDTKEIMIVNWIKYNNPISINSIKCVKKELVKIKHKVFVKILFNKCLANDIDVERIFENYKFEDNYEEIFTETESVEPKKANKTLIKNFEGAYKVIGSNREEVISKKQEIINKKEEEVEEVIKDKKNSAAADSEEIENIIKIFKENVHAITPLECEKILEYTNHVAVGVIIMAIEEAVSYNAKTLKYIVKVLDSWISLGLKTAEEVRIYQKKWINKKSISPNQSVKKGGFCDFEQRTYDYDDLEKRLLGKATDELE